MKQLVLYVHGKGGSTEEAAHYQPLFPESDVIGLDYQAQTPWDARQEFQAAFETLTKGYDSVILIANSIGAYFSMHSLSEQKIAEAFLISPFVDMEQLILNMLHWENLTELELREKRVIPTKTGEILSWDYLCYVREHPIRWRIPTQILYGSQDVLTSLETMQAFADQISARLTVMENGEHWFHTQEQIEFLDNWLKTANI